MDRWQLEEQKQKGVRTEFSISESGDARAVFVKAEKERRQPYFGPQTYFDAKKGISFTIRARRAERMLGIYQHKDWWIRPAFLKADESLPERTQLLLTEHEEGYTVFLAVCSDQCRTDFSGTGENIVVTMASNRAGCRTLAGLSLVEVSGGNPYVCCERAVSFALELLGRPQMKRECRRYPEMLEYFGWCSWDAFYHQVNEKGLLEKLEELAKKQIPARWVLIDDGWLDADYEQQVLRGLDADRTKFPEGLAGCVAKLKSQYGVRQVGVWHAIMGYWNGLEEGSEADRALACGSRRLPDGRIVPAAEAGKSFLFYDKWHTYLRETCGIDFIKVDGQSAVSLFYEGMESYGEASSAVQKGLGASAALHFDNNLISCMGMASEEMWNRPLCAVSRSSDDFVPNVPRGFVEHAVQNGYNNLLQGQFFWGDWDMFWSGHEENRQNSMLRAVSGGPVYVSDAPGQTDDGVLRPLMYSDGRLLRCDGMGVPTLDCLFENPAKSERALKIFNRKKDCYVIAAFPVNQSGACVGSICTGDIPGLAGKEYVVYSWKERKLYPLNDCTEVSFALKRNDAALFVLIPVREESRVLGLVDKYVGIDAVKFEADDGEKRTAVLREGGEIGIWSRKQIRKLVCAGKEVPFEQKGELYLARVESREEVLLEIW